jgi:hypothetical protein
MGVLEAMRRDAPDDPVWKGVADTGIAPGGASVRFNEALEPRHLKIEQTEVECHLYDDEALAAAERARLRLNRDG